MLTVLLIGGDHYKNVRISRMIDWEKAGMEFVPVEQALSSYKMIELLFPDIVLIDVASMRFTNMEMLQTVLVQHECHPAVILFRSRETGSAPAGMNVVAELDADDFTQAELDSALRQIASALVRQGQPLKGQSAVTQILSREEPPHQYLWLFVVKPEQKQQILSNPQECIREVTQLMNAYYGGRCAFNTEDMLCLTLYSADETGRNLSQRKLDDFVTSLRELFYIRFHSRISIFRSGKITPTAIGREYEQLLGMGVQRYFLGEDEVVTAAAIHAGHGFDYIATIRLLEELYFGMLSGDPETVTFCIEEIYYRQIAYSFSMRSRNYVREMLREFLDLLRYCRPELELSDPEAQSFLCFEDEAAFYLALFVPAVRKGALVKAKFYSACKEISKQYHTSLSLESVAEQIGVSSPYLSKLFKSSLDTGFAAYLNKWRINEARLMLLFTEDSAADIAARVGYSNPQYFNQIFRRITDVTPGYYRSSRNLHETDGKENAV